MLLGGDPLWIVVAVLALDALIGDPDFLWRRIPHPVALLGLGISTLDRWLNRESWSFARRRIAGVVALLVILVVAIDLGHLIDALLDRACHGATCGSRSSPPSSSPSAACISMWPRPRCVRSAGIGAARRAVAMIVGRDPESLDQAGVCRAAIEVGAENFSDGVVAPAFWLRCSACPVSSPTRR